MIYRPSFVCMLTFKLDESAVVISPEERTALKSPAVLTSTHGELLRSIFPGDAAVSHRLQPLRGYIDKNSHMVADEASMTFSWKHVSMDPRFITGGILQVFAGTISEENYREGFVELDGNQMVNPRSIVRAGMDRAVFTGAFDKSSFSWGQSGNTFSVSARDFTQHLLDKKVPTSVYNNPPNMELPINEWVFALLETQGNFTKIFRGGVETEGFEAGKIPKALDSEGAKSIYKVVRKGKKGRSRRVPRTMGAASYWDFIVDMCVGAGAIANVEGERIVIRPGDMFSKGVSRIRYPFRRVIDGKETSVRRFTLGRYSTMKLERKHLGTSVPGIMVVTSTGGKTKTGLWPPDAKIIAAGVPTPGIGSLMQEKKILVIPTSGVYSTSQLTVMAKGIWEQISRSEMSGTLDTMHLASDGGDNDDPDLMYLNIGDPIEIRGQPSTEVGSDAIEDPFSFSQQSKEAIVKALREVDLLNAKKAGKTIGNSQGREVMYNVIATAMKSPRIQPFFRTAGYRMNWEVRGGLKFSIRFHNYHEVLWDNSKDLPKPKGVKKKKPKIKLLKPNFENLPPELQ